MKTETAENSYHSLQFDIDSLQLELARKKAIKNFYIEGMGVLSLLTNPEQKRAIRDCLTYLLEAPDGTNP